MRVAAYQRQSMDLRTTLCLALVTTTIGCQSGAPGSRGADPAPELAAAVNGSSSVTLEGLNLPHCNPPQHLMCNSAGCFCGPAPVNEFDPPSPWYQVINIEYSLPGSMSEVDYSQGSYVGSQTSFQRIASIGVDAQASLGPVDVENKFTIGTISGGGNGLQITSSTGVAIATNMTDDVVHHEKDIFSIWVNPLIRVTSIGTTITGVTLVSNGIPVIETVNAGQLLGLTTIPSWQALSTLTAGQKQQILAMDPFFSAAGFNPASTRFEYKLGLELDGPVPGGNFVAHTYDLQTDMSSSSSSGWQLTDELTADYGFIPKVFKAGIDLQYQYQSIATKTTGTIADASLKIGTVNECVHVGVDVYRDKAFNTFITVPRATDQTGAASGWDCCDSSHSLCEQGDPLDGGCTANNCLQTVCGEDPYCCTNYWDDICVGEATACSPTVCGNPH